MPDQKTANNASPASFFSGAWFVVDIFNKAFGEYKFHIIVLAALSFLSGILEGIGINSIIPLFSFIHQGDSEATDAISGTIGSLFAFLHIPFMLKTLVIFIAMLFILKSVTLFCSNFISSYITSQYEMKTRRALVAHTFGADWTYLSKQKLGHLDQLLTTSMINSSNLLSYAAALMVSVSNILVFSFLVFSVSHVIAISTVLFGVLVFFMTKPLFRMTRNVAKEVAQTYKELAHTVNEVLVGIKPIKSMYLQYEATKRSSEYFEHIKSSNIKLALYRNISAVMFQPVSMAFVLGIFLFFYKTSTFNIGSFAVIVYSINKVFSQIQLAQSQLHLMSAFAPHTQSLLAYTNDATSHKEKNSGTKSFIFEDNITFRNVAYAYGDRAPAISNVHFTIKKGETVGIVGPSGGGKTTVTDLLLGLLSPTQGDVLIDDVPLSEIDLKDLRRHVGYVSQEIFLLNDTVENNIKFFNDKVSHAEVVRAATVANCLDFINELPDKFKTVVGERGVMLSVGQRQRIALARVLARKPALLVLDEATSALDTESETLIQKAIDDLHGTITVVAIAHRLSTIMNADRVVVLGEGTVLEVGSPKELLSQPDSYFAKVNRQA